MCARCDEAWATFKRIVAEGWELDRVEGTRVRWEAWTEYQRIRAEAHRVKPEKGNTR